MPEELAIDRFELPADPPPLEMLPIPRSKSDNILLVDKEEDAL